MITKDQGQPITKSAIALGDINWNGTVDADDLVSLRRGLLATPEINCSYADLNGDGVVSIKDLIRFKKMLINAGLLISTAEQ